MTLPEFALLVAIIALVINAFVVGFIIGRNQE